MSLISVSFRWHMAHILDLHFSPCARLHGHSYNIEVQLSGEVNKDGMVMDFGEVKDIISNKFDGWDHRVLLPWNKTGPYLGFCTTPEEKAEQMMEPKYMSFAAEHGTYIFPAIDCVLIPDIKNTTAEELSRYMFGRITEILPVTKVIVRETESNYAEYNRLMYDGETRTL